MTMIELCFDHRDKKNCSYYRPVGCRPVDHDRGPSLLVNQTFVSGFFGRLDPKNAMLTFIVQNVSSPSASPDARPSGMKKLRLRFHYIDNGGFSYYKRVGDHRDRGPSLLVNQTLVADYFRGMDPEYTRATLVVAN